MTDQTVYRVTGHTGRGTPYHTKEDCLALRQADDYRELPLETVDHYYELCQRCAGNVTTPDPTWSGEERSPSTPTTYKTETVVIGEVWTASRGFVDQD